MELISYKNNCRICLKSQCTFKNIFTHIVEGTEDTVDKIICSLFAIKLNTHGAFPQQICRKCILEIENMWLFKESLVRNEQCLNDKFSSSNPSNEEDSGLNLALKDENWIISEVVGSIVAAIKTENDPQPNRVDENVHNVTNISNCLPKTEAVVNEFANSKENSCTSENVTRSGTTSPRRNSVVSPSLPKASFLQNFNLISQHDARVLKQKKALKPNSSKSLSIKTSALKTLKKNNYNNRYRNNRSKKVARSRSKSFLSRYGDRNVLDNNERDLVAKRTVLKGCEYENNNNNINAQSVIVNGNTVNDDAPPESGRALAATFKTLSVPLQRLSSQKSKCKKTKTSDATAANKNQETPIFIRNESDTSKSFPKKTLVVRAENLESYNGGSQKPKTDHIDVNKVPESPVQNNKSSETLGKKRKTSLNQNDNVVNTKRKYVKRKIEGKEMIEKVRRRKQPVTKKTIDISTKVIVNKEKDEENANLVRKKIKKVAAVKKKRGRPKALVANNVVNQTTDIQTNSSNNDTHSPSKIELSITNSMEEKEQLTVNREPILEASSEKNDSTPELPIKDQEPTKSSGEAANSSKKQLKTIVVRDGVIDNASSQEEPKNVATVKKKLYIYYMGQQCPVVNNIGASTPEEPNKNDSAGKSNFSVRDEMAKAPTTSSVKTPISSREQVNTGSLVKEEITDEAKYKYVKKINVNEEFLAKLIEKSTHGGVSIKEGTASESPAKAQRAQTSTYTIEKTTKSTTNLPFIDRPHLHKNVAALKKKLNVDQEYLVANKIDASTNKLIIKRFPAGKTTPKPVPKFSANKAAQESTNSIGETGKSLSIHTSNSPKNVVVVKKKLNVSQRCPVATKSIENLAKNVSAGKTKRSTASESIGRSSGSMEAIVNSGEKLIGALAQKEASNSLLLENTNLSKNVVVIKKELNVDQEYLMANEIDASIFEKPASSEVFSVNEPVRGSTNSIDGIVSSAKKLKIRAVAQEGTANSLLIPKTNSSKNVVVVRNLNVNEEYPVATKSIEKLTKIDSVGKVKRKTASESAIKDNTIQRSTTSSIEEVANFAKKLEIAAHARKGAAKSPLINEATYSKKGAKNFAINKKLNMNPECPIIPDKSDASGKSIQPTRNDSARDILVSESSVNDKICGSTNSIKDTSKSPKKFKSDTEKKAAIHKVISLAKRAINMNQEGPIAAFLSNSTDSAQKRKTEARGQEATNFALTDSIVTAKNDAAVKNKLNMDHECSETKNIDAPSKRFIKNALATKAKEKITPESSLRVQESTNSIEKMVNSPRKQFRRQEMGETPVTNEASKLVREHLKVEPPLKYKMVLNSTESIASSGQRGSIKNSPTNVRRSQPEEAMANGSPTLRKRNRLNRDVLCLHEFYLIDDLALTHRLQIKQEEEEATAEPPQKRTRSDNLLNTSEIKKELSETSDDWASDLSNFNLQLSGSEPESPQRKKLEPSCSTWQNEPEMAGKRGKRNVQGPLKFSPKLT